MKSIVLLCLAGLALLIASCSVEPDRGSREIVAGPSDNSDTEWTVLIYGAGNTSDDILPGGRSTALSIAHSLQTVYPSPHVHSVALIGTALHDGHCGLYDIQFDPGDTEGALTLAQFEDLGVQDMSSPDLIGRLVSTGVHRYPAQHYMLAILGDGDGWRGVCRDDIAGSGNLIQLPELDQTLGSIITIDGHAVHLDLMLWLAPEMCSIEAAYQFGGMSDYMIATSSLREQPGFLATGDWYLDLNLDPTMDARRLSQFVVSRMTTRARAAQDSFASFDLLDFTQTPALLGALDELASALHATVDSRNGDIVNLWHEVRDSRVDDSTTVDLRAFANAVLADPGYASDAAVQTAATHVLESQDLAIPVHGATWLEPDRGGVSIFTPPAPDALQMAAYHSLRMSRDHSAWYDLLVAMQDAGSSIVNVSGQSRWVGHELHHVYTFLNTAQFGTPVLEHQTAATFTVTVRPDSIDYQASFALNTDSVAAYYGVFEDLDGSQTLTTGDRYGWYHRNPSSLKDWLIIHRGDVLDSLFVDLSRTY